MKEIEILKGLQPNTPYGIKNEGNDLVIKLGQKTDWIEFELGSFAPTQEELVKRLVKIETGCGCTKYSFKNGKFCIQYDSNVYRGEHLKKYEEAKKALYQNGVEILPVVLDDISVSFLLSSDDGSHFILNKDGVLQDNKDFKYTYNFQIKIDCNV